MKEESLTLEQIAAHEPRGGIEFDYVQSFHDAFIIPRSLDTYSAEELTRNLFIPWAKERYWFLGQDYAGKIPSEQWRIQAGSLAIRLYNYVAERKITDEEISDIAQGLALFDAHFPLPIESSLESVAVTHKLPASHYKNPKHYPTQGMTSNNWHLIQLAAGEAAFRDTPYREDLPAPTLQAVLIHELAHLALDTSLSEAWKAAGFSWTPQLTTSGRHKQKAGEYLYTADQPEACVSDYARTAKDEDIAESVVAYLLMPKLLDARKRRILRRHDARQSAAQPVIKRQRPKIPLLPRHIRFAIAEQITK